MSDFFNSFRRFGQFGGWRLVLQYAKIGVLWKGCRALLHCVLHGRALKEAYPIITHDVESFLVARYRNVLDDALTRLKSGENSGMFNDSLRRHPSANIPKIIWFSWLQGIDKSPEIVQICLKSQIKHLPDYEFRIVDLSNYREWVQLPSYVDEKYSKGLIPDALFSDLLRLSLLEKYGGVWMDASVYCSGFRNERLKTQWRQIMDSELTLFRYFERGTMKQVGLSNWFIAARKQHPVVSVVLKMLFNYWKDFECTLDYYIAHLFLDIVLREFPEVLSKMPHANSRHSLLLGHALCRNYNEANWIDLTEHVSIHKLNYRKVKNAMRNKRSYCTHLMNKI